MLSFLGTIGRMLPGYVQGERQAVEDNWKDLSNYNTVQQGQIQNALDEALFNPRIQMGDDMWKNSRMQMMLNAKNYAINQALAPVEFYQKMTQGLAGIPLQGQTLWTAQDVGNWMRANPGMVFAGRGYGGFPTLTGMFDNNMFLPSSLYGGM